MVKNEDHNNESAANSQKKDENYMDSASVKGKDNTRPSEAPEYIKRGKNKSRRIRPNTSISRTVCKITTLVRS